MKKKECEDALNQIEESYYNSDNSFGAMKQFKKDVEVLNILITDHFEKKPLEFEELKEGMWVWDDKLKEWCVLGSFWKDALNRYYVGGLSDSPWEQNRFYRKQVEE